jgi:pilus assembly protein CpaE
VVTPDREVSQYAVTTPAPSSTRPIWPWKFGLILETPELKSEIEGALAAGNVQPVISLTASTPAFEVAHAVEQAAPDVLFVEFPRVGKTAAEWMAEVCQGSEAALVIAVHIAQEPSEMINALRAGASEFLCLPIENTLRDAVERIGAIIESRRAVWTRKGRLLGVLSAKGGCGATSVLCYLAAALNRMSLFDPEKHGPGAERRRPRPVLVADLDWQAPAAHRIFKVQPQNSVNDVWQIARRLNSSIWRDCVSAVPNGPDLLAAPPPGNYKPPDEWRAESLFRFVNRQYRWVLVDLGRQLSPINWIYLQHIDDLMVVTAPDVLALYQTRAILQTLAGRGFDKHRVRIVLNQTYPAPQDFWVESIEQMFEIGVYSLLLNDPQLPLRKDRFDGSPQSPFGRSIGKCAEKLIAADNAAAASATDPAKKMTGGLRKGMGL